MISSGAKDRKRINMRRKSAVAALSLFLLFMFALPAIAEAAYGALQISKDVLVRSLEDLYNRGHIFATDAIDIAEEVLCRNPKRIFKL